MLGTNDTKPRNWKFKDNFTADYRDLIAQFANLPSKPRVFSVPPRARGGQWGLRHQPRGGPGRDPAGGSPGPEAKAGVIDIHAALKDKPELLPETVHPNTEGATLMARAAYRS